MEPQEPLNDKIRDFAKSILTILKEREQLKNILSEIRNISQEIHNQTKQIRKDAELELKDPYEDFDNYYASISEDIRKNNIYMKKKLDKKNYHPLEYNFTMAIGTNTLIFDIRKLPEDRRLDFLKYYMALRDIIFTTYEYDYLFESIIHPDLSEPQVKFYLKETLAVEMPFLIIHLQTDDFNIDSRDEQFYNFLKLSHAIFAFICNDMIFKYLDDKYRCSRKQKSLFQKKVREVIKTSKDILGTEKIATLIGEHIQQLSDDPTKKLKTTIFDINITHIPICMNTKK